MSGAKRASRVYAEKGFFQAERFVFKKQKAVLARNKDSGATG